MKVREFLRGIFILNFGAKFEFLCKPMGKPDGRFPGFSIVWHGGSWRNIRQNSK